MLDTGFKMQDIRLIGSCKTGVKDCVFKSPLPPFFKEGVWFPPLAKGDKGGFKDLYLTHDFLSSWKTIINWFIILYLASCIHS